MECGSCHKKISSDINFCPYCGIKQTDAQNTYSNLDVADYSKRFFAYMVDSLIIMMFMIPFIVILDNPILMGYVIFTSYYTFTEASSIQASIGKKIVGLKVTDRYGHKITIARSLARQFSKLISSIAFIGFIFPLFTQKRQALHDLMSGCLVVNKVEGRNQSFNGRGSTKNDKTSKSIFDEQSVHESIESVSAGEISRKVKRGLSSLPVITVVGDVMMGMSGVTKQLEYLKDEPKEPLNWLQYYECYVTYQKIQSGVGWARLVVNPVGFAVSKGVAAGLNVMDDQHQEFSPIKCLKQALMLCEKRIKYKNYTPQDIAVLGKTYFYLSINEDDMFKATVLLKKAIQFMSKAIELEKNNRMSAEYFYFLSQFYQQVGNEDLRYRSLNISRKMGFKPALDILKQELLNKGMTMEELKYVELPLGVTPISTFRLTFKPSFDKKVENMITGIFVGQGNKIKETSDRLKRMID